MSDVTHMTEIMHGFGSSMPPLRGIVHAAADLSNWAINDMPLDAFQAMLKPKVTGTWIPHSLTKEMDLDFFILFSSTTALFGSHGLGHYAAANHFLDGFAHYRHAQQLPALSINWGTWDKMRAATMEERRKVAEFGLQQMPSEQTLKVLGQLINSHRQQIVVAAVDWNRLKSAYEIKRNRPLLAQLGSSQPEIKRKSTEKAPAKEPAFLQKYVNTRQADRPDVLTAFVRNEVSQVLGMTANQSPDLHQGLFEMGLDSLMAIELKNHLEVGIGQSLPSDPHFQLSCDCRPSWLSEYEIIGTFGEGKTAT